MPSLPDLSIFAQKYMDSVLIPNGMIVDRVERMARDILRDYEGTTVHLLVVLKVILLSLNFGSVVLVTLWSASHRVGMRSSRTFLVLLDDNTPTFLVMLVYPSHSTLSGVSSKFLLHLVYRVTFSLGLASSQSQEL